MREFTILWIIVLAVCCCVASFIGGMEMAYDDCINIDVEKPVETKTDTVQPIVIDCADTTIYLDNSKVYLYEVK